MMIMCAHARPSAAQEASADTRSQYPPLMANGFFGVSFGAIDTPFTASQLAPGSRAAAVRTPSPAFKIVLMGHQFNRYLSAEVDYERAVHWLSYDDVNGTGQAHSVWVVLGEFKLTGKLPVTTRLSFYGDAGVAVTSRHGAKTDAGETIVADVHYPAVLVGGGLDYQLNPRWSLQGGISRAAGSRTHNQPRTILLSGGVRYHLSPLPADRVAEGVNGGHIFPEHVIQFGLAGGIGGAGPTHFVSRTIPIFWGGHVSVHRGFTVRYEQNLFHTRSLFAFDLGTSVSSWQTARNDEHFFAASVYPLLRFILLRTRLADFHLSYSVAGPTYISTEALDGLEIGTTRFTFQDLIGLGVSAGKRRQIAVGMGLGHYSNGNLFPANAGVAIPLTFSLGYAF